MKPTDLDDGWNEIIYPPVLNCITPENIETRNCGERARMYYYYI